jgi:hypothetical protein
MTTSPNRGKSCINHFQPNINDLFVAQPLWWAQIRVEIFKPQYIKVLETVGKIPHWFDTDSG